MTYFVYSSSFDNRRSRVNHAMYMDMTLFTASCRSDVWPFFGFIMDVLFPKSFALLPPRLLKVPPRCTERWHYVVKRPFAGEYLGFRCHVYGLSRLTPDCQLSTRIATHPPHFQLDTYGQRSYSAVIYWRHCRMQTVLTWTPPKRLCHLNHRCRFSVLFIIACSA